MILSLYSGSSARGFPKRSNCWRKANFYKKRMNLSRFLSQLLEINSVSRNLNFLIPSILFRMLFWQYTFFILKFVERPSRFFS